jgi:adenine/guanine phosphoribosyltransferase-like PRPP-binding protein
MLIAFAIVVALWFKIPTVRSASVVSILVAGIILALSVASILPLPRYIVRKSTNSLALKS